MKTILTFSIFLFIDIITLSSQWLKLNNGLTYPDSRYNLVVNEKNKDSLITVSLNHYLYQSDNYGEYWYFYKDCEFYVSNYIKIDSILFIHTGNSLLYSNDDNKNWKNIELKYIKNNDTFLLSNFLDFFYENKKLFVSHIFYGTYYSNDLGLTWNLIYPRGSDKILYRDSVVYFADFGGISYTNDFGKTWEQIFESVPINKGNVNIFTFYNNKLLICYSGNELWEYDFSGKWSRMFVSSNKNVHITNITYCSDYVYLVLSDSSFSFSKDNGKSWQNIKLFTNIDHLLLTEKYAFITTTDDPGSVNSGIYRAKINQCIVDPSNIEEITFFNWKHLASIISPNPASDFIEISVGANVRSPLQSEVRIYDVLGQCVNLTPALSTNGEGVNIDVSGLAPGMYFVRIGDKVSKFVKM